MATLDLSTFSAGVGDLKQSLEASIRGIQILIALPLTDDEVRPLKQLFATYQQWDDAARQLQARTQVLQDLGYPNVPTLDLTPDVLAKLTTELQEAMAALGLLHAAPVAASILASFGTPEPQ